MKKISNKILNLITKCYSYFLPACLIWLTSILIGFLFIVIYDYTDWVFFLICSVLIPFFIIFSPIYNIIKNLALNYWAYLLLFIIISPLFYIACKYGYTLYLLQNQFDPYLSFYTGFCDIYIKSDPRSRINNCILYLQDHVPISMLTNKILKNGNGALIPSCTEMSYLIRDFKTPKDIQMFANFISILITYNICYFEGSLTKPQILQETYYTYLPLVCKALGLPSILEGTWTII
jgi:hypothetical protein